MLSLSDFAENIRRSDGVVVFTGAGISTESAFRISEVPAEFGRAIGR
jgi:NAD-dependent SIR2 family protein deacetylase